MTRTKLRKNHAAIIASLRDKVAVITADRDDLEEQRQALNKMVDAAETRAATARREAFGEAEEVVARANAPIVRVVRDALRAAIRAARDRGTP